MKLYLSGNPYGALECGFEDAMDEIEDYPSPKDSESESFIGLENDKHFILNLVRLGENEWGIIAGDVEKVGFSTEDMKKIVKEYYEGVLPEWATGLDRNDFPDGLDDILEEKVD